LVFAVPASFQAFPVTTFGGKFDQSFKQSFGCPDLQQIEIKLPIIEFGDDFACSSQHMDWVAV
jgi:hypothetical protein